MDFQPRLERYLDPQRDRGLRARGALYWTVRLNCCMTAFELLVAVIVIG